MTLANLLHDRSLSQPNQTAFTFLENGETESDCLTYQELALKAQAIAAHLQSHTNPGDRVLLVYTSGL
ncbi:putative aMP-dependent synthetase and ligase [Lyngbya aestuarii BL J]|uniref:Putative aMP-dependent synthetase and ligase n=1 Tax=Lyngbya aestuarii BL J TaxID=1348334 RepID=U7QH65_9CYAN|nr:AMP-binding protein [Lyngbya aestuarii]ERT07314.1 putative aMP-dependent synthetase and ligase [Lyngbya aestuarii BL J]